MTDPIKPPPTSAFERYMTDTTLPEPVATIVNRLRELAPHLDDFEDGETGERTNDGELLREAATALQEALDRAERAERERDEWRDSSSRYHDFWVDAHARATTAEAALDSARKVIEPFAECEIDEFCPDTRPLVSPLLPPRTRPNYGDVRAARQWLSANQKETPNADK